MEDKNALNVDTDEVKELVDTMQGVLTEDEIKKNEKLQSAFLKSHGVETMEEFIKKLAPHPSCTRCYGRGYTGYKAPIINWKDMPKGQQQKKPARDRHTTKGERINCTCVTNQYLKALASVHEDWDGSKSE